MKKIVAPLLLAALIGCAPLTPKQAAMTNAATLALRVAVCSQPAELREASIAQLVAAKGVHPDFCEGF